jgi:hypothetical protein
MLFLVAVATFAPPLARTSAAADMPFDEPQQSGVLQGTAQWIPMISVVAGESGVPWQVLRAVMTIESGGNSAAFSATNSGVGLMLVTPEIRDRSTLSNKTDLWDPKTNVRIAAEYLRAARQAWGSWDLAVASWYDTRHPDVQMFNTGYNWDSDLYRYIESFRSALAELEFVDRDAQSSSGALLHAMTAVGMPYVYGGGSFAQGGFDCSGLTSWAYTFVGKSLPRSANEQWVATARIHESELRPGDLVFFSNTWSWGVSHVGIYAGNGMMLHAPSEGKVVEFISLSDSYWSAHLTGYGRVE